MARREFTEKVQTQIIKRATRNDVAYCELCGDQAKRFQIDHIDPDALQIDKSKKLTAAEGQLLCIPCHKRKTAADVAKIAKAKRVEARHAGAKTVPVREIPTPPPTRSERTVERSKRERIGLPPRTRAFGIPIKDLSPVKNGGN